MVKKKKKVKIKYRFIFIFLIVFYLLATTIYYIINISISNIYIYNNKYLTDQQIIELAGIGDYPPILKSLSGNIKNKLLSNIYIMDVNVSNKKVTEVHIDITENRPLFFYQTTKKTILLDGRAVDDIFHLPTVINYIPDVIYRQFVPKMGIIDEDILIRISEIKYDPNEVDNGRFFLTMNDGNYVYLTIDKFDKLNNYLQLAKNVNNKKGVFYLDYGNKFDIFEE
ncbi:MAG: FtsQ-type POTRA domain-containing protein [Bacilli bacterium]|nr:FtsQ-type POTRA domain-containing protein [Bacilli bacterium]MDD4809147.1 FtsQ-type POTRA domain-containing protein [Bacilli bacterium]